MIVNIADTAAKQTDFRVIGTKKSLLFFLRVVLKLYLFSFIRETGGESICAAVIGRHSAAPGWQVAAAWPPLPARLYNHFYNTKKMTCWRTVVRLKEPSDLLAAPAPSSPAAKLPPGSSVAAAARSNKKISKVPARKVFAFKGLEASTCGCLITSSKTSSNITKPLES